MKTIMLICPEAKTFNFRKELIKTLCSKDIKVILVSKYGRDIEIYKKFGCCFENIDIDRRGKSIVNDLNLIRDYFKVINKNSPDIVLTYTTKCSVYGGIVSRVLKVPYIVNNAGLISANGFFSSLLKTLYKIGFMKAKCMIYQNDEEQKSLQLLLKNRTHFRRVPGSGVDLNFFKYSEYPNKTEPIVFNFVARIMKSKGIEEFLNCAKYCKTKYPNVEFRIYGTFDDNSYEKRVYEYSALGIVKYCNQTDDMRKAIRESFAVIHPSYYEGMTNVILEHSAMGRPCIGSDVAGVCDGIDDEKTGLVFQVADSNSLIEKVEKFINFSYQKKVEMGRLAREKMVNEFDRKLVTKIYLEEIEQIIGIL